MAAFEIKQNDLLPVFRVEVSGAGDLSDATLRFHMRKRKGALVVDAAATVESYDEATDTNVFRYDWIAGDTATTGSYQAEFEATTSGKPLTTPTNGFYDIVIFTEIA
jgi:hypothetical protein